VKKTVISITIFGLALFFAGCANLERDQSLPPDSPETDMPPEGEFTDGGIEVPPDDASTPPDVSPPDAPPPPDASPPDVCEPECECDADCSWGKKCHKNKCYRRCDCDDDCSGPGNMSCDHGLCKGH